MAKPEENLRDFLLKTLSINSKDLTVSAFGRRSDEEMISWASLKSAAVVSNDKFSKEDEDQNITEKSNLLAESGRILNFSIVTDEVVVPGLVSM